MNIYREDILEAAKYPSHYGKILGANVNAHQFNPSCGDDLTVYLKLDQSQQKIIDLGWEGNGCVISRASMSFLAEKVIGMKISLVNKITKQALEKMLGFTIIAPGREKCMMMSLMALNTALKNKK